METCRIIATYNFKGGTGKTTTVINLAASLAIMHKRRVLVVDLDPQANATRSLLGKDLGENASSIRTILLAETHAQVRLADVVIPTHFDNLSLLPADIALSEAELKLTNRPHREFILREALRAAIRSYDFILLDCPPSLGLLSLNALAAAESVLVPCSTQFLALRGLSYVLDVLALVRERLNPQLKCLGILPTQFYALSLANREVLNYLISQRGHLPVMNTVIPRDVRAEEAPNAGLPLLFYSPAARSTLAYLDLAREVIERCQD